MSNYINNLIAKNQNTAEVLRPRLPSLFEPPLVAARTDLYEINEVINPVMPLTIQQTLSEEAMHKAPRPRQIELSTVREKFIERPTAVETDRDAQMTNPPSARAELPDWRGLQLLPQQLDEASISSPPLSSNSLVQPTSTMRSSERRTNQNRHETDNHSLIYELQDETPPGAVEEKHVSRRAPGTAAPPQTGTVTGQSRLHPSIQANADTPFASSTVTRFRRPADERIAHQGLEEAKTPGAPVEANATRIVVQPHLSRREADQATGVGDYSGQGRMDLQLHDTSPMPTINVTIGRIEVKALPPAVTRPRPQKNAGQLMSLDEYMRRRNGGGDSI